MEEKDMFMPLNVAPFIVCIPLWVPLTVPAKALNQFGELTSGRDEGAGITSKLPLHSRKTISALPKGTRVTTRTNFTHDNTQSGPRSYKQTNISIVKIRVGMK